MTKMKQKYIQRCELGALALEANEVKQRMDMYNPVTGGRCCLCVLLDVAVANGYKGKRYEHRLGLPNDAVRDNALKPHRNLFKWFGLSKSPLMENYETYVYMNDEYEANNHRVIGADFRTQHDREDG